MDHSFRSSSLLPFLKTTFSFEKEFRSQSLPINPNEYFPNTLQSLKPIMSSPCYSETDMIYCAQEIQKLYPNLKPSENREFQSLNNRIRNWNQTPRTCPNERLAKVEQLPAYVNKKLKALEDLLTILYFEERLFSTLDSQKTKWQLSYGQGKKNGTFLKDLMELPSSTIDILEKLKDVFPYLEFLLQKEIPNQKDRAFLDSCLVLQTNIGIFHAGYSSIHIFQKMLKTHVEEQLLIVRFSTFENLITTLRKNDLEEIKEIFCFNKFEEFIVRQKNLLKTYNLSDDEWNAFIQRLDELYPVKNRTIYHNARFAVFHKECNPKLLAGKDISYECCSSEPSERISASASLNELNQLVSHLQLELSMIKQIELYLSTTKKTLELFESKQKNSISADDKINSTCYPIQNPDVVQMSPLSDNPYVLMEVTTNGFIVLHLKPIEKKQFNYKAMLKSLDSLIKKTHSRELKEIYQSMKAHVELMRLVQANNLETDFQGYLKSLEKSTIARSLTPFLNDTQNIIQFFPPQPITPAYFSNPSRPNFLEANHTVLEKIHTGWNENKKHQTLLLNYAKSQIAAIKKANKVNAVAQGKPTPPPVTLAPPAEQKRNVSQINLPEIVQVPINIVKAVIQGTSPLPRFSIPQSTFPAREMRKLTQQPPGKPFRYNKTLRVLDWENHPFGMELPTKVFSEKYTSLPLDIQKKIHIFHFPHPFVDLFLHMGIEGVRESNRRVDIIAEIQYNNTTFKGVIGYTFDGKDCYHRCFTERLEDELAELRAYHLKQQEFPLLAVATAPIPGRVAYADLKSQVSYDRSGNVIIKDSRRDVIIKLFKI